MAPNASASLASQTIQDPVCPHAQQMPTTAFSTASANAISNTWIYQEYALHVNQTKPITHNSKPASAIWWIKQSTQKANAHAKMGTLMLADFAFNAPQAQFILTEPAHPLAANKIKYFLMENVSAILIQSKKAVFASNALTALSPIPKPITVMPALRIV